METLKSKRQIKIGERFGRLVTHKCVEEPTGNKHSGKWECNCDCGTKNITMTRTELLINFKKSCGCLVREKHEARKKVVTVGQKFSKLTVLGDTHQDNIKCVCDCGRECFVPRKQLISGNRRCCGCFKERLSPKNMIGRKFGILIVCSCVEKSDGGNRGGVWKCNCECGKQSFEKGRDLRSGSVRHCGCGGGRPLKISTGDRFGILTVVSESSDNIFNCKCDCGKLASFKRKQLVCKDNTSCGCLRQNWDSLIGKKFDIVTVVSCVEEPNLNNRGGLWLCRCDCGNKRELLKRGYELGKSRDYPHSCGCLSGFKDAIKWEGKQCINFHFSVGEKIGTYTVVKCLLEPNPDNSNGGVWACLCDCGKMETITGHELNQNKIHPKCTLPNINYLKNLNGQHKVFWGCSAGGYGVSIPRNEWEKIVLSPCVYCGNIDIRNGGVFNGVKTTIKINGVDRVDSSKGYIDGNCVSCCSICNKMKLDHTLENFLAKVKQIYDYRNLSKVT